MEKVNIYKGICKALLVAIILCSVNILSYGVQPLIVEPDAIFFNFEAGNLRDALAICDDTGNQILTSEWNYANDDEYKFAYIKDQSPRSIKVSFKANDYSYTGAMHLIIKLSYPQGTDGIGSVCNYFVSNYKCTGTALCGNSSDHTITLNLTGQLPQSVGKHRFKWKWDIYAIPVDNPNYCSFSDTTTTFHTYYTLLAAPQAPMAQPWSSVLEKACTLASLKSTDSDVLNALTTKLYSESGLIYTSGTSHYRRFYDINRFVSVFYLSELLNNWNNSKYVDCRDVSMFLSVLSSSIGASLTQTRRINGWFDTKSIIPIGQTATTTSWYFHQVGWNNNVYDACIKFNTSPTRIPINENIDNPYKIDLVDPCSSCQKNWTPLNAFRLGETDPYSNDPTEIR